jgi:hypothetical protein
MEKCVGYKKSAQVQFTGVQKKERRVLEEVFTEMGGIENFDNKPLLSLG